MKLYRVLAHRDGKFALKPIGVVAEPDAAEFSAAASKFTSTSIPSNREQIKRETNQIEKGFGTSNSTSKEYAPGLPNLGEKSPSKPRKLLKRLIKI